MNQTKSMNWNNKNDCCSVTILSFEIFSKYQKITKKLYYLIQISTHFLDHEWCAEVLATLQAKSPGLCIVSRQTCCNYLRHFLFLQTRTK